MVHPVELVLALLAVTVALALIARKLGVAEPIFLVVGGLLLGLQPWVPGFRIDPQVVFLLFLPPLLYAAAFRTPWPEFRAQLRAITLLAVGLVLFTTAAVAAAAHYLLDLPWAVAFVLGAIVSPPDAVAAVAVTQRLRVPRLIVTILEGESLVNDATALVALRFAVAAVATGAFSLAGAGWEFVLVSAGGVGVGVAGGWLVYRFHRWLDRSGVADSKLVITVTLLTPFAVYLTAEHLHLSGVLAAVSAGLWIGNRCEEVFTHELFEEARAVWEWIEFLLNGLVFILVGFALRQILEQFGDTTHTPRELAIGAAGVCGATIVARLLWMFPGAYVPRWVDNRLGCAGPYPSWRSVTVVGWTGMRGAVSLAAALALPLTTEDGRPFPGRDLIQLLTFAVIFATLVGQGLTLPLLIKGLGVSAVPPPRTEDADESEREWEARADADSTDT
ncbi:Na+/H+ antiporter [Gemmata sp. JC717]|uniref:Na+/H+ antiporter n=1 Tax=Gemmata algarum TaxID=2975278 RepID=UPI0021BA4B80|nr:Na+/H+ antiporter [Gemmata algarum]MDY3557024.1 Na+/H+ antiporter [Gemmata algarum]